MSEAEYKEFRCIFCGLNSKNGEAHILTNEHIIPEVLGGWLTIPFVCKTCNNDYLGSKIESKLKKNAYVVSALDKLKIQSPDLAYRNAKIEMDFDLTGKLIGYFNEKRKPEYYSQKIEDESIITPENKAKEVLSKQIERFEKKTGQKVDFDVNEFDNLPYNIVIPIYGTDISFIKRRDKKPIITITGLDQPIPFRIPAIIAFEHLSGLYYPFVLKEEFDPIKSWILSDEENRFVLLNTNLNDLNPSDINFLPFHYIRIGYQSGGLSAIVELFGIIKFLVFLAEIENIDDFPPKDILNYYHVYDLKKRKLFPYKPSIEVKEQDDLLLKGITIWGLGKLHDHDL